MIINQSSCDSCERGLLSALMKLILGADNRGSPVAMSTCRYISHPAISEKRLSLTHNGRVRYELKTPYHNGTTHVIFKPLDFIAKLAALVPKPRVNLTRFHGVFAPNSKHRIEVTLAKRGKKRKKIPSSDTDWLDKNPEERHQAMTWMQRLKRVFDIDIETCEKCGGQVKVTALAHPAPAALVHPCTSLPALRIRRSLSIS